MTDREFLRGRRSVRLMKQLAEMRRERDARDADRGAALPTSFPELDDNLQRLKDLADRLDRLR